MLEDQWVTEPGHYPTVPGLRDPRWYVTDEVTAPDAIRCEDEWDFGGRVGTVQCSRQKGHEGSHFANGDNPYNIYYRWWFIPLGDLEERED